ncbi:rho-related GTP-binding protein RhoN-like [Condylostylus longicornis]|uniref:rho-related GTP-binding protein RhoN-like n=1 Tax=Condylostylus longicornis TaxID=2530218 RepID=UPI00244E45A3|nr:rho-related GTP-binding protein RhoN-like [Condylostylus longicornis]
MSKREKTDSLERPGAFKEVKIVLVGPAKCGKTALVQRFVNDIFSETYIPTGFEKYQTQQKISDLTVDYQIWDTSGGGAYDSVRPLAYQDANVFMLCFNVGDQDSLTSAINKWCIEIRRHCRVTPIILCGCRTDNRSVYNTINYNSATQFARIPVTSEQALLAANHIGAAAYVETSSQYSNILVPEAFRIAAEVGLGLKQCLSSGILSSSSSSSSTGTNGSTSAKPPNKKLCKEKKSYHMSSPTLNRLNNGKIIEGKPDIKNEVRMKTAKNCCIM